MIKNGAPLCWGNNLSGELGNGSLLPSMVDQPGQVAGLDSGMTMVSAGNQHTCAVSEGGALYCWGDNNNLQLGIGVAPMVSSAPVTVVDSGIKAVSAGFTQTCALTQGGAISCWGIVSSGQLGVGPTIAPQFAMLAFPFDSGMTGVGCGDRFGCAINQAREVYCWGRNDFLQLGDPSFLSPSRDVPGKVQGLGASVLQLSVGESHACVLLPGGSVRCWGNNSDGRLGNGTPDASPSGLPVQSIASGALEVAAGGTFTCARTDAGTALCWGGNVWGQLGDGTSNPQLQPTLVSLDAGVVLIASGSNHVCALMAGDAGVQCWGANNYYQLGNTGSPMFQTPVNVPGL